MRIVHDTGGFVRNKDIADLPCPTITNGHGGSNASHFTIRQEGLDCADEKQVVPLSKPPYRVPSMQEINVIPWNGFRVASSFSGCGGSCLGYRMAGFKVVWANEFVPIAQESYRANFPDTHLDCRDIKLVQPEEILAAIGLKKGELDLLDGSPPCQAFSTSGKREKGWGKNKKYEHGAQQKNETLFTEYIRLLRGLMPKVFIAENVSGLIKGTAKGFFLEILKELKASGYRVSCRVLDAKWLGVPQSRQRTIFVGAREDLSRDPVHPLPLPYLYTVRDAIGDLLEPDLQFKQIVSNKDYVPQFGSPDQPHPTIVALDPCGSSGQIEIPEGPATQTSGTVEFRSDNRGAFGNGRVISDGPAPATKRKFTIAELKRICACSDDFILCGKYNQQWERLGNCVPPVMAFWISRTIRDDILLVDKPKWPHDPPCLIGASHDRNDTGEILGEG